MMRNDAQYRDTQYSQMLLVLGTFIVFGVGVAVGAVYGFGSRVLLWIVGAAALLALLQRTRLRCSVDAFGVSVDRASLPWEFIERIEVLEGEGMRLAIGPGARPNDFLRLRRTTAGMRVWLRDASDPHRAWVVSVREPQRLRDVLTSLQPREQHNG